MSSPEHLRSPSLQAGPLLRLCAGSVMLASALLAPVQAARTPKPLALRFAVLNHEPHLQEELAQHDGENLGFVVVNGIRTNDDPCTESLYQQRKNWLDDSEHSIFVSLAGSDWLSCGTSTPLQSLREQVFDGEFSLGSSKLPLTRQAVNRKFRNYVENVRWELNGMLFATLNLPAGNNHYRHEAGRNGEFEDRQVANRFWLQRLFALAQQKKIQTVVLFSDGDLWQARPKVRRDGFLEVRNQITQLAGKMHGKVVLIDNQTDRPTGNIQWRGNVGHISLSPGWHEFRANPGQAMPLSVQGSTNPQEH